ncbi:hypothetical protein ACFQ4X_03535 [Fictibacillus halophilus]|uniref:hypothetical protein n=1 Tax=Fictibacillus halophilus TaxID=1610490 RepID=UPI003645228B
MALRIPLVFTLIMFTGTVLESLFPEHWDVWQKALLVGGLVGLIVFIFGKIGYLEKRMPLWLGISILITGFILSVVITTIIEKQA